MLINTSHAHYITSIMAYVPSSVYNLLGRMVYVPSSVYNVLGRMATMDLTSGYFHPFLGVEFSGEIKHENATFHPLLRVKSGGFGASSVSFN